MFEHYCAAEKKRTDFAREETGKTSIIRFMGIVSRSFFDVTLLNRRLTEQALVSVTALTGVDRRAHSQSNFQTTVIMYSVHQ